MKFMSGAVLVVFEVDIQFIAFQVHTLCSISSN